VFFKPKIMNLKPQQVYFPADCSVDASSLQYADYILTTFRESIAADCTDTDAVRCESVSFHLKFTPAIQKRAAEFADSLSNPEAYAILIDKKTKIYANDPRGFIYAISTLRQLREFGELRCGFIYDYPICETRGYRVFLPTRAGFDIFFKTVDFLACYKFNSIILEIGGAMEYKRHPEINDRWAEFCREVHAYSGRSHEIQHKTYPWRKNSIHCDNAGGDILTQDECRTLAAYCRSRGLEVIPECPTHCHCDYLVMAHPELREREGDAYPDTYCPNHPDTYRYVFDILEEVIDVFKPEKIHIGHDEMYSIAVCPRCRKTSAPELYAKDITTIHAFLKERGIETMMWGEKLLNAYNPIRRGRAGGAVLGNGPYKIPATYPARDLIPHDIHILHWFYHLDHKYDKTFHDRGFPTVFGNLKAINVKKWNLRLSWGMRGGYVSNWGSFEEEYMQRNQQYLELLSTAYAFWCEDFESLGREKQLMLTFREAYRLKCTSVQNPIRIVHTTPHSIPYKYFFDGVFIVDKDYLLGHYEIVYQDGKTAKLPVKFGTNIGCSHHKNYLFDSEFMELSYGTMPKQTGDRFVYECVYENPYPDGKVSRISYVPADGKEEIEVELLSFSLEENAEQTVRTVLKEGIADSEFARD